MGDTKLIRFREEEDAKGFHFLLLQSDAAARRGSYYSVTEETLKKLEAAGWNFEILHPESREKQSG